jgi:hypothetical protein
MTKSIAAVGVLGWLACAPGQARECHGVAFPDQVQLDGTTLVLNGLGLRQATIFKVNVYVAALYLPKSSTDASAIMAAAAPYEMRMHFVRSVSATDIAKGWTEGFERNGQGAVPASDARVATLRSWMQAVNPGQEMKFTFRPGSGVDGTVNGTVKGTIHGDDFGRALLSVWLGVPPNPEIKSGLLGGQCD